VKARPECKYGVECHRANPDHHDEYYHPPGGACYGGLCRASGSSICGKHQHSKKLKW
jgi:hypothetical protein